MKNHIERNGQAGSAPQSPSVPALASRLSTELSVDEATTSGHGVPIKWSA